MVLTLIKQVIYLYCDKNTFCSRYLPTMVVTRVPLSHHKIPITLLTFEPILGSKYLRRNDTDNI